MDNTEVEKKGPAALSHLSLDQQRDVVEWMAGLTQNIMKDVISGMMQSKVVESMHLLGYTQEVAGLVQLLASKSGDSVEAVMKKALNLYGIALGARERGNRIAILDPEDEIVQEITGFEVQEISRA